MPIIMTATVNGYVKDENGNGIEGIFVRQTVGISTYHGATFTDSSGHYTLGDGVADDSSGWPRGVECNVVPNTWDDYSYYKSFEYGTATVEYESVAGKSSYTLSDIVLGPAVRVSNLFVAPGSLNMALGNTAYVSAAVYPYQATDKTVFWSSSDGNIAEIVFSESLTSISVCGVSGLSEGTCTITATTVDGELQASCTVNVIARENYIFPTGVTIIPDTITIAVQEEYQLNAELTPSNAEMCIMWYSENFDVASVDASGKVIGISVGTTIVSGEGYDEYDEPFVGHCTVTVTAAIKTSSISVFPSTASVKKRGTVQLTATVLPTDATNKNVVWSSSSTAVATVNSSGLVTGIEHGICTIIATTEDGGLQSACTIAVDGTVPTSSGVEIIKFGSGGEEPAWEVETEKFTDSYMGMKVNNKVKVSAKMDTGSTLNIYYSIDGGTYILAQTITGEIGHRLIVVDIIPERCFYFKLKLSGTGKIEILSVARQVIAGSDRV